MRAGPSKLAACVFVSPLKPERFLVRVTPGRGKLNATLEAVRAATVSLSVPVDVHTSRVTRTLAQNT